MKQATPENMMPIAMTYMLDEIYHWTRSLRISFDYEDVLKRKWKRRKSPNYATAFSKSLSNGRERGEFNVSFGQKYYLPQIALIVGEHFLFRNGYDVLMS